MLVGPYSPGTYNHTAKVFEDPDELIKDLQDVFKGWISRYTFGDLNIGEVSEILDNDVVKILLYDDQSVNRNVKLVHNLGYVWIDDGYEKRIEDIELG